MAVNPMDAINQAKANMEAGIAQSQAAVQKGVESAQASAEVMKVLKPELQARILRPDQHIKTGRIVKRMQAAKYSQADINSVVQALVAFRDEEMRPAFELLSGGDGSIDAGEMKILVPLIGENLDEEQVRCLFEQADKDHSGLIDFEEFCQMMYSLTPKAKPGGLMERQVELTHAQEAVAAGQKKVDDGGGAAAVAELAAAFAQLLDAQEAVDEMKEQQNPEPVTPQSMAGKTTDLFKKFGQNAEALGTLDPPIQSRVLRPPDHQRAGRVIQRMRAYPKKQFSRKDVNDVILSLVANNEGEMTAAFKLWAGEDGLIDAGEFQEVVPLLGEDCKPEEIEAMFKEADKDGNGTIDAEEFNKMMWLIQMKGDSSERHKLLGRAKANGYAAGKL